MAKAKAIDTLKAKAKKLKQELFVLFLAYKDQRVPWYVKLFALSVVAYAFSPIDLIPDFIPIIGYIDDLIIVPIGISIALKLIPPAVLEDCRIQAEKIRKNGKPKNWFMAAVFILIWILVSIWLGKSIYRIFF